MKKYKVVIGFDPRERVEYDVARKSIIKRCKDKVTVRPLELEHLGNILTRPIEKKDGRLWCPISQAPMATEFAISRFAIPFIEKKGWVLFIDSDMLCHEDIGNLFDLADDKYAVMVVKHNHNGKEDGVKMDGQVQTYYSRKNWSSVVLWNCDHPSNKNLTLEALNTWPGRDLHAFKWLKDEEIGELPQKWNWLINVTEGEPKREGIWHFTLGTPLMPEYKDAPYSDVWFEELKNLKK